jgi:hypothetical protein
MKEQFSDSFTALEVPGKRIFQIADVTLLLNGEKVKQKIIFFFASPESVENQAICKKA